MSTKPEALSVGLDALVGRFLEIAKDGRWLPGTIELQMVQALAAQRNEIARLRSALSTACDGTAQIDIDAAESPQGLTVGWSAELGVTQQSEEL